MGKNQQRRAARRRARAAGAARPTPARPADPDPADPGLFDADLLGGAGSGTGRLRPGAAGSDRAAPRPRTPGPAGPRAAAPAVDLTRAAALVQAAADAVGDAHLLDDAVQELIVFAGTGGRADPAITAQLATARLLDRLHALYEHGWQPADVMHVLKSRLGHRFTAPVAGLLLHQARHERASARAPQHWLDQLSAIADLPEVNSSTPPGWTVLDEWDRSNPWDAWHDVATLLRFFLDRHPMRPIAPPPSSWPARRVAPRAAAAGTAVGHDPRKLAIIRALLAKAEATEYAEEADAFTAKAQDLMTRYAIDEALLAETEGTQVRSRRVHVDNPYAAAKAHLLATVGRVNRVKAIWDDEHAIGTIVGAPVDLELVEMLFTSLLVQATRAMTEAGAVSSAGHRLDRRPSFRRAFLLAYADRIGERLVSAGRHAEQDEADRRGSDLLPVLARRSAAVDREFERLFSDSRQSRSIRVDARGWQAGRAAADRAVLVRGQVGDRPA